MQSWQRLETDLVDIIRRICADGFELYDLENGDKALVNWALGYTYEVLNITELAKELDARGVKL